MRPPHPRTGLLYVLPFARLQIACPSVWFFLALAFQCLRCVFFFNGVVSVAIGRCLGSLLVWGWRSHGTLFPGSSFLQAPGTWREWVLGVPACRFPWLSPCLLCMVQVPLTFSQAPVPKLIYEFKWG